MKIKEEYQVKISSRFAALENLYGGGGGGGYDVDTNTVWKSSRENIRAFTIENLGYYELKQPKTLFEVCPELFEEAS